MLKQYFSLKVKSRYFMFSIFVLACYTLLACFNKGIIYLQMRIYNHPFFLANFDNFFSSAPVSFILCPIFFILRKDSYDFFGKPSVMIRFSNHTKWWQSCMLVIVIESTMFVSYLYLLLLLRTLYFHKISDTFKYIKIIAKCYTLQVLGFISLALIFCFFSFFFRSALAGFAVAYSFVIIEFFLSNWYTFGIFIIYLIEVAVNTLDFYVPLLITTIILILLFSLLFKTILSNRDYLKQR